MATNPDSQKETIEASGEEDISKSEEGGAEQDEDSGKENKEAAKANSTTPKVANHNVNGAAAATAPEEPAEEPESITHSNSNEIPNHLQAERNDEIMSSALSWIANDPIEPAASDEGKDYLMNGDDVSCSSGNDSRLPNMAGGHIVIPDSFTFHDDKSEGTRPDPPSTTDGRDAAEILNDMNFGRPDEFYDPPDALPTIEDYNTPKTTTRKEGDAPNDEQGDEPGDNNDSFAVDETRTVDVQALLQTSREQQGYGADNLALLPPVDEERFQSHSPRLPSYQRTSISSYDDPMQGRQSFHSVHSTSLHNGNSNPERRKIQFRLCEEVLVKRAHKRTSSLLGTLRKNSTRMLRLGGKYEEESFHPMYTTVERGTIAVSWYNGTSSLELQQHVKRSVTRQLKGDDPSSEIDDFRILDESTNPPEEIVLSPFIPSGSSFLLLFTLLKDNEFGRSGMETPLSQYSSRPPLSPSAAPSPHPSERISRLDASQLALLSSFKPVDKKIEARSEPNRTEQEPASTRDSNGEVARGGDESTVHALDRTTGERTIGSAEENDGEPVGTIDARLEEIRELLLNGKSKTTHRGTAERRQEKRQVVFVVANYFVLFLALIALSAEMQARAPNWMKMMENHLKNVRNCSENQEALFECVSRGDFAGLIASVGLWLSRSVATRRIFLFGFDTPKKLWTVVYESLVSSICWGISYVFIRRGMNPDTRHRFIQRYWKDAVYGSLAGFNATFLKQILKNLIPEDAVEDAFKERQLKILGWLPSFA